MKSTGKNAEKAVKPKTVNAGPSRNERDGQEKSLEVSTEKLPPNATKPKYSMQLLPRVIRFKDAPGYLGMDRNRFNKEVRPGLVEFPIGTQGIGFDRQDLDAWFDEYKQRNGRPGHGGTSSWQKAKQPALSNVEAYGTSTSESMESEFAKALERATSKKRSVS